MIMPDATCRCVGHVEVIYMKLPPKERWLFGAVWLWCITQGYTDVSTPETYCFAKDGVVTAFVLVPGKTHEELLSSIRKAKEQYDRVIAVTNNANECPGLAETLPAFCGIFCSGNPFELGQTVRTFNIRR